MIFFKTRKAARIFKQKNAHYTLVDNGSEAKHRWGVKVLHNH